MIYTRDLNLGVTLAEVAGSSPARRWRLEARPAGWWETAFGLWRWRDVERLAASEAAGGSQAVVAEASGTRASRKADGGRRKREKGADLGCWI